jgi:hypothetical protein
MPEYAKVMLKVFPFVGIVSLMANSAFLAAMLAHRRHNRRERTTYILSLTIASIQANCIVILIGLMDVNVVNLHTTETWCVAFDVYMFTIIMCGALHMCVISLDQFCFLFFPFLYRRVSSAQFEVLVLVVIWLTAFAIGCHLLFDQLTKAAATLSTFRVSPFATTSLQGCTSSV